VLACEEGHCIVAKHTASSKLQWFSSLVLLESFRWGLPLQQRVVEGVTSSAFFFLFFLFPSFFFFSTSISMPDLLKISKRASMDNHSWSRYHHFDEVSIHSDVWWKEWLQQPIFFSSFFASISTHDLLKIS